MIKTKVVATLGPACSDEKSIKKLFDRGVDMFRLNFSHGTLEEHGALLDIINRCRKKHSHEIAVMGDLCGPKIRISDLTDDGKVIKTGDKLVIVSGLEEGTTERFGTNYKSFAEDVAVGHRVLIDDGLLSVEIVSKEGNEVTCSVIHGGPLKSRKGINLPDTDVSQPALTERDWECVDWAIEHQLDYLALSFVRSAEEVQELKDHIRDAESRIKVVPKIEKPQAVECLEDIVRVSDAVLVARGDLGVEMDLAQVPLIQKRITRLCQQFCKPVIVATQMLQSMIENPCPTRAEVSDVANAIMDLADAVMLSGETAVGKYPMEVMNTIRGVAEATEAFLDEHKEARARAQTDESLVVTASVARSVAQIIDDVKAELVVVWSEGGSAGRLLSKARIDVPIIAFSSDPLICRQMSLHYGVVPLCQSIPADVDSFAELAQQTVVENGWAHGGDQIVLVAGRPLVSPNTTNTVTVQRIAFWG